MQRELPQQPVELTAFLRIQRGEDLLLPFDQPCGNLLVQRSAPGRELLACLAAIVRIRRTVQIPLGQHAVYGVRQSSYAGGGI